MSLTSISFHGLADVCNMAKGSLDVYCDILTGSRPSCDENCAGILYFLSDFNKRQCSTLIRQPKYWLHNSHLLGVPLWSNIKPPLVSFPH